MKLHYILMDFGASFATRGRGQELREDLQTKVTADAVVIDFAGVTNVSYSFADELVGKLVAGGMDVSVENMSAPVARSVQRAMARRVGAPAAC